MRREDRDLTPMGVVSKERPVFCSGFAIFDLGFAIAWGHETRGRSKVAGIEQSQIENRKSQIRSVAVVHLRHEFGESRVVAEGIKTLVVLEVRLVLITELD